MLPVVGRSRPPMRFSNVVLPEPDGPINATKSPRGRSRSSISSTGTISLPRLYCLATPRSLTTTGSVLTTTCSTAAMFVFLLSSARLELDLAAVFETLHDRGHQFFAVLHARADLDRSIAFGAERHGA